jgi:ADP-heptose:LPS heptosyltransferase
MQDRKVNRNGQPPSLVLFPGSLGDFLCFLPALEEIANSTAGGVIEVAARGELAEMIGLFPYIRSSLSLDSRIFARLFSQPAACKREEEVLLPFPVSKIFSWFGHSHPEVEANLCTLTPGQVRSFAFFTGQEDCHASVYYRRCVGAEELRGPSLLLEKKERQWLDQYWQLQNWLPSSRVLIVHPGSGGQRKRWVAEGFVEICRWWQKTKKGKVLVVLGPAEEKEVRQWRQTGSQVESGLSLVQVAALVSRADVYVGNDSGISHLAGAVGARGIVLFGPTSPRQWRPLGGALSIIHNIQYRTALPDVAGISLAEISCAEVVALLARL